MSPRKQSSAIPKEAQTSDPVAQRFPIVAIGASAGGLEALEQFLSNVPETSGMAYVVIQHLDPTQKGMLPELLQRIAPINVLQAYDGLLMKPDCIYVISPNKSRNIPVVVIIIPQKI